MLDNSRSSGNSVAEQAPPASLLRSGDIAGVLASITEDFKDRAYFITG